MHLKIQLAISAIDLKTRTAEFLVDDDIIPSVNIKEAVPLRDVIEDLLHCYVNIIIDNLNVKLVSIDMNNSGGYTILYCVLIPESVALISGRWLQFTELIHNTEKYKDVYEVFQKCSRFI